jgi:hypothetical protein
VLHTHRRNFKCNALDNCCGELSSDRRAAAARKQQGWHARDAAILMKLNPNFGFASGWKRGSSFLILMLAFCFTFQSRALATICDSQGADASKATTTLATRAAAEWKHPGEIKNFFMDYAGDHSLDAATVIEQPTHGYAKYIVHLHLASGSEQSVVVTAPPGGLQIEMQDMTGDKIANDVVLRPALVRWLPTVLINDGHEHFRVAVSGTDPASFSSPDNLGSRKHDSQIFAFMMSSGFKSVHLLNKRRPFGPQHQESLFYSCTEILVTCSIHATSAGRAPPTEAI